MTMVDQAESPRTTAGTPQITIRTAWCKGCTFCVAFCPKDVLKMDGMLPVVINAAACTRCLLCVYVCPDFGIRVE